MIPTLLLEVIKSALEHPERYMYADLEVKQLVALPGVKPRISRPASVVALLKGLFTSKGPSLEQGKLQNCTFEVLCQELPVVQSLPLHMILDLWSQLVEHDCKHSDRASVHGMPGFMSSLAAGLR
jgi:hypothetical protein